MANKFCADVAAVYSRFAETEKEWRDNYNKAEKDKVARDKAHAGMKTVVAALKELQKLPRCSPEKAKEIFGKDFLGAVAVEKTFGFAVRPEDVPPIRFSAKELKEAHDHNEQLILRVSYDAEGKPMTMERMLQIMAKRIPKKEKLLASQNAPGAEDLPDDCWYKTEEFFWKDSLKMEWVLVGKDFVPETTNKNYVEQTLEIYKYMQNRKILTESEETEYAGLEESLKRLCFEMGVDWKTQEVVDQPKYDKNWPEVTKKLANLPINQKHRRDYAGILFDWLMNFKAGNGRGKLENLYDWSNTVSSAGALMSLGDFASTGARVAGFNPAYRSVRLWVVFVRGSSLHK
jgi:hypothetical protein